jgi:hypothetical protein
VNGTRSGSSEITLDGTPNMYNSTTVYAPQDLVQEFKIKAAGYGCQPGPRRSRPHQSKRSLRHQRTARRRLSLRLVAACKAVVPQPIVL